MQNESDDVLEDKYRKAIEQYLATKFKASINQISSDLGLSWATVKKHLDYLQSIGRVHGERLGNSIIYFFNGRGDWQEKIQLTPNHVLFLDTFVSYFGEPFVRIKEAKKEGDKWRHIGDIMITKNRLKDVIRFLTNVEQNIDKYNKRGW